MFTSPVTLVIGLGSNCHAPTNIRGALLALRNLFPDLRHSTPQETAPLQHTGPDYINAVATATTTWPPTAVIQALKQLERNQNRSPLKSNTITLDLDLLAYGNLVSPQLRLPRPELFTRDFNRIPAQQLGCLPRKLWGGMKTTEET